jgi:hypothetical protein
MRTFDEILAQVTDLVQQQGRVSYRALERRFAIDDEYLEDLKAELIDAKRLAADEDGKVLVWAGTDAEGEKAKREKGEKEGAPDQWTPPHLAERIRAVTVRKDDLTPVLSCAQAESRPAWIKL